MSVEPPAMVAPIEITSGNFSGQTGIVTPPGKPLSWAIRIGKDEIRNRQAVTYAYLNYVLLSVAPSAEVPPPSNANLSWVFFLETKTMVTLYINASYWGGSAGPKGGSFWGIRRALGQKFADKLAVKTLVAAALDAQSNFSNI
jgi:hypothetical protein